METRKPIEVSPKICRQPRNPAQQIFTMMAERSSSVNEEEKKVVD